MGEAILNAHLSQLPPKTWLGRGAWLLSNRITHGLAGWVGKSVHLLPVAEHPRSGGTWVAHMLADYFDVPFPKYSLLPLACAAVVHTHLGYSGRFPQAVFVARDGRDVVISSYFYILKRINHASERGSIARHRRRYPSLCGATSEPSDCRERLPAFISEWWARPFGCHRNWADYTSAWTTGAPNVVVTKYESLRIDCVSEMLRVIGQLSHAPIDITRLESTVSRFSFETQTGRKPGEEDISSNKRKGQVGDWRNYFSRAAAEAFQSRAGQALIQLGYETDESWVARCS